MKRIKKVFKGFTLLGIFIFMTISFTGCETNKALQALESRRNNMAEEIIKGYEVALQKAWVERVDLEKQIIENQFQTTLLMNAYINDTGKSPNDIKQLKGLSINDIEAETTRKDTSQKERLSQINNSYKAIFNASLKSKNDLAAMNSGIAEARGYREETFKQVGIAVGAAAFLLSQ